MTYADIKKQEVSQNTVELLEEVCDLLRGTYDYNSPIKDMWEENGRTQLRYHYNSDLSPEELIIAKEINSWFPISIDSLIDLTVKKMAKNKHNEQTFALIGDSFKEIMEN